MTMLDQPGGIDEIRAFDGVQDVRDGNPRSKEAGRVRSDLKFGNAAALYDDCRNTVQPIEARFKVVGRNLPKLVRRYGVGGKAVTNDGKDREGEPMCFHFCGRRQ